MNISNKKAEVKGFIAFYGLRDWWISTFSDGEQAYIDNRYQPMGMPPHCLTQGEYETSKPASQFLNELGTWFRGKKDFRIAERIHAKVIDFGKEQPVNKLGYYKGRHYTTFVSDVASLKKAGRLEEAEKLLIELVTAIELKMS